MISVFYAEANTQIHRPDGSFNDVINIRKTMIVPKKFLNKFKMFMMD